MDLGIGVWAGGNGSLRILYAIYPALADAVGAGGIRRIEPAGPADFSGHHVERMAIRDHTPRGTGNADAGGARCAGLPAAHPARISAGAGLRWFVHGGVDAAGGF